MFLLSFSRQPHIRLDQITQNYFSRVWNSETVFSERAILNRKSHICPRKMRWQNLWSPLESRIQPHMFASWCGYWGVGIFQELTVNQHDTTCSTAFCINNNFSADGVRGRDRKHATHAALEVESVQHRTGIIYLLMSRRPRSTAKHIYQKRKRFLGTFVATIWADGTMLSIRCCRAPSSVQHMDDFLLAFLFIFLISRHGYRQITSFLCVCCRSDFSTFFCEYKKNPAKQFSASEISEKLFNLDAEKVQTKTQSRFLVCCWGRDSRRKMLPCRARATIICICAVSLRWFIKLLPCARSRMPSGRKKIPVEFKERMQFHLCMKNFAETDKKTSPRGCHGKVFKLYGVNFSHISACRAVARRKSRARSEEIIIAATVSIIISFGALSNYTIHLNLQPAKWSALMTILFG